MQKILRNKDQGNFMVRYWKSFCHALNGIRYALFHEHNMIIILLAMLITSFCGFYFDIKTYEWLFCILSFGLVAATEMINTSIEATIDLVTKDYHPLAKLAKDTASSATLIFAITSLIGAVVIFVPYIQALF